MILQKHIIFFYYLTLIIAFNTTHGQTFKRVEQQAMLNGLSENMGVSVADYDGDNDLDVFIVANAKDETDNTVTHSKLFKNLNNGSFEDVTVEAGLMDLYALEDGLLDSQNIDDSGYKGYKFGASWADFNNDGFPDLLLTNAYRIQLFKNTGIGTFEDVTTQSGLLERNSCYNTSATWFDFNNDGLLDLYIGDYASNTCEGNSFYVNNGNGTFNEMAESLGVQAGDRYTYMSIPIDVNNDGWLDLYLANDYGENDLFVNQEGGAFVNKTIEYSLNNNLNGMGLTIGDYNNDGLFDMYLTNILSNALFVNNGDETFQDLAVEHGVLNAQWAWDTRFSDLDLDGDEDIFVANGFVNAKSKNVYYKNLNNDGGVGFLKMSDEIGITTPTYTMSLEIFDYDNDGDMDIFVSNVEQSSFFYENNTIESIQTENTNWFKIRLEGTVSNRDAIGAKVSIKTNDGSQNRFYTGVGLFSQSLQPIHFGLGNTNEILELKIIWPSGEEDTYFNLPINNTILAKENNGYEVLNIVPSVKILGCTDPNSCSYNPDATLNDDSCTYLETKQIAGNRQSTFFKTETYTYPLTDNSKVNWSIVGGEIIEGQGTGSITVKWDLDTLGKITVVESNSTCTSLPVELEVALTISEVLEYQSIARIWNEALLNAIRGDYARPTVHARNLYHCSIAMYDAWAVFNGDASPYLLGNTIHEFFSEFDGFEPVEDIEIARNKAISYAVYRLLSHRFKDSPSADETLQIFDMLMEQMGYDIGYIQTDYTAGNSAALGNYIAQTIINYGLTDGSREQTAYDNSFYEPVNPPLKPFNPGDGNLVDPNRWQPLSFNVFIDQGGNVLQESTPEFLSPEWGNVKPFSLKEDDRTVNQRNNNTFYIYHDPGNPPLSSTQESDNAYKWGFSLVSKWSSHLDASDSVLWDISPNAIGNISEDQYPTSFNEYKNFYNELEGGDIGKGHPINPIINLPYTPQIVPRGDYTRVLAEFWADGPDSETPPGHWFTLLNYVNDHPLFYKKFEGKGDVLDPLEWDVKAYFVLGGTMHDAAIAAWGIKGWYDYIRPISAVRYMAEKGQSTSKLLDNYNTEGIPLEPGLIEVVMEGDPLEGNNGEHIGKIKLFAWKGHHYIEDPINDQSGVDWILAENWVPYQRSSFVTPPFAGYVSGHSTYSRAAAEVMTLITGSPYFPGGYGEFLAKKNEFLVFEEGPSVDIKLQWATYRDASDQCSLSRIWGGIHPPADDIPGRLMGQKIGIKAFYYASEFFQSTNINETVYRVFPNPVNNNQVWISGTTENDVFKLFDIRGTVINLSIVKYTSSNTTTEIILPSLKSGIYILRVNNQSKKIIIQ